MFAPTFKQAVAQANQNNTTDQNALIERLRLIDQRKIEKCHELIENLKQKQEALKALYMYSHKDRENLRELLGNGMTELFLDPNSEKNLKIFKQQLDLSRKSLEDIQVRIHANKKLKITERAKMEYLQKVIESNDREIRLLDQELEKLKVLYRFI